MVFIVLQFILQLFLKTLLFSQNLLHCLVLVRLKLRPKYQATAYLVYGWTASLLLMDIANFYSQPFSQRHEQTNSVNGGENAFVVFNFQSSAMIQYLFPWSQVISWTVLVVLTSYQSQTPLSTANISQELCSFTACVHSQLVLVTAWLSCHRALAVVG